MGVAVMRTRRLISRRPNFAPLQVCWVVARSECIRPSSLGHDATCLEIARPNVKVQLSARTTTLISVGGHSPMSERTPSPNYLLMASEDCRDADALVATDANPLTSTPVPNHTSQVAITPRRYRQGGSTGSSGFQPRPWWARG